LIEESGGLLPFLEERQLEFVRIFSATKTETRNEDGDTVLEMGSEEYLISKALSSMNSGMPHGIESLLTHMEGPARGASYGTGHGPGYGEGGLTGGGNNHGNGIGTGGTGNFSGNGGVTVYAGGGSESVSGPGGYLTEMQRMVE
jgi:hypothetical protein